MAASSLSAVASEARVWAACVAGAGVAGVSADGMRGRRSRTRSSFMCGRAEVATARRVESVGHNAIAEGENATHALLCGARFWLPAKRTLGVDRSRWLPTR